MSPLARAGGKYHRISYDGGGFYALSWRYEVKYYGSRILHHRTVVRTTEYAGAMRFAKKWNVPMPNEGRLWAKRVRKSKRNAYMPERVLVVLEGRPGHEGLLMVNGWSAVAVDGEPTWPKTRLTKHLKTITAEWKELSGPGWKLEIE